jgi:ribosome biogenesis protein UTP30
MAKGAEPAATAQDMATADKLKVKRVQLEKAIRALVQLNSKRSANANPLFGANSETMQVMFTLGSVPTKRTMKPMLIELPHPMFGEKSEVCFFAKDPQKMYKEMLIRKHPIPGLTKVIGLDKLKRNYKTGEAKRALADAFDLFLCDSRIVEMMPKILGAIFYEKKMKRPIPVRLKHDNPGPNLQRAINGTTMRIPTGPCLGVKFGRCSMDEQELVANAAAVVSFVSKHLAGKIPLAAVAIQATDSPALPVWRRAPPPGEAFDLKKHHSDAASSSASDTGTGAASETEDATSVQGSELPSDVGETFGTRASDISETGGESLSEMETASELDSELDANVLPEHLPLLKGLKGKRKRRLAAIAAVEAEAKEKEKQAKKSPKIEAKKSPKMEAKKSPKMESQAMPPPKKIKKSKA